MLVHDFALVTLPGADMADAMARHGRQLLERSVGSVLQQAGDARAFELHVGDPLASSQATVVPFALHLDQKRAAFQHLQGDLEFFELEPSCCQLRLQASYDRFDPFAPSRVDHARVETIVRAMLNHLARALEAEATHPCHG